MSMSTHVVGFKPPNAKWQKMKAIYDACREANVGIPDEVEDFFGCTSPDDNGMEVDLESVKGCVSYYNDSNLCREGFEIDVTNLPKDVTIIRFYNSW